MTSGHDFCFIEKDNVPVAAFLKSAVGTVQYGFSIEYGGWGCYVGVNGNTSFVPNMTVEEFFDKILRKPLPVERVMLAQQASEVSP